MKGDGVMGDRENEDGPLPPGRSSQLLIVSRPFPGVKYRPGKTVGILRLIDPSLDEGVYVIGFSYPVVPQGKARIRVQVSAAHSIDDLDFAVAAFCKVRDALR